MSSTSNDVAVRPDTTVSPQQQAALAIRAGQTSWLDFQKAAFGQIGIADAPEGDQAVFLHVSQRTGLDPFARQIYMIPRKENKGSRVNGQWVDNYVTKWTIQTGIEGWRVIRQRAERREGVRGTLSRPVWYDENDNPHKVWTRRDPPLACELTYTVRDINGVETDYTSVLAFWEYAQTAQNGNLIAQWLVKKAHMIEKCTEADVYRKAFPQDFSGVYLDDAMPLAADPDGPDEPDEPAGGEPAATRPGRVTGAMARERGQRDRQDRQPQHVASEVIPPGDATPPDGPGEYTDPRDTVIGHFCRLGHETTAGQLAMIGRLTGKTVPSIEALTGAQATWLIDRLGPVTSRDELEAAAVRLETSRADDASEDPRDE